MFVVRQHDFEDVLTFGEFGDVVPDAVDPGDFAIVEYQVGVAFGGLAVLVDLGGVERKVGELDFHVPASDGVGGDDEFDRWDSLTVGNRDRGAVMIGLGGGHAGHGVRLGCGAGRGGLMAVGAMAGVGDRGGWCGDRAADHEGGGDRPAGETVHGVMFLSVMWGDALPCGTTHPTKRFKLLGPTVVGLGQHVSGDIVDLFGVEFAAEGGHCAFAVGDLGDDCPYIIHLPLFEIGFLQGFGGVDRVAAPGMASGTVGAKDLFASGGVSGLGGGCETADRRDHSQNEGD